MTDVRRPHDAGQVAAPDPATEARAIVSALRLLAFDAAAPQGQRAHTRSHLRRTLKAHFRALEARIDALAVSSRRLQPEPSDAAPESPAT
jgi:hypothetical protein